MAQEPRPPLVQSAAVLLFVVGALNILGALPVIGLGGIGLLFGLLGIAVGAAAIYAGVQILALREKGRAVGVGIAALGIVFGIYYITQGVTYAFIGLLINGFIIYALNQTRSSFR
jgi:hypothetical protein